MFSPEGDSFSAKYPHSAPLPYESARIRTEVDRSTDEVTTHFTTANREQSWMVILS